MKKARFVVLLLAAFCADAAELFCQNSGGDPLPAPAVRVSADAVPDALSGIWQGADRLLMFSDETEFAVVLRVFYQWYNDRAAEPVSFTEIRSRDANNASARDAEHIRVKYITVFENASRTAGAYELEMYYPGEKEPVFVPVCVIDGKLYLDFLVKGNAAVSDFGNSFGDSAGAVRGTSASVPEDSVRRTDAADGFYRCASSASGITISPPHYKKEVVSYFVSGTDIYKICYWLSEMEYSYSEARFSDGEKAFFVDKYLRIGSDVYQCTTGRSSKIRNIEKSGTFEKEPTFDGDGSIVALGEPYLVRVPDAQDRDALLASVEQNNARRKPVPPPLFPPSEIDFHWKDISELEKYNPYTWNRRNLDLHK